MPLRVANTAAADGLPTRSRAISAAARDPFRPSSLTKQIVHICRRRPSSLYRRRSVSWLAELAGARTLLVVPMLKESELIGTIALYRQEVRPFTDKQIELVTEFRRAGRHRHREHAAAQRTAGDPGAADRDLGSAQGHCPFAG